MTVSRVLILKRARGGVKGRGCPARSWHCTLSGPRGASCGVAHFRTIIAARASGVQITKAVITAAGRGARQYPAVGHRAEGDAAAGRPRRPDQAGPPDHRRGGDRERDRGDLRRQRPGRRGGLPPPLPAATPRTSARPSRGSTGPRSRRGGWSSWSSGSGSPSSPSPTATATPSGAPASSSAGEPVPAAAGRPPLHLERAEAVRPAVARPGRRRGVRRLGRAGDPRAPDPPVRHPDRQAAAATGPTSTRSTRSSRSRTRPWPSCGSRSPASARGITSASSGCTC